MICGHSNDRVSAAPGSTDAIARTTNHESSCKSEVVLVARRRDRRGQFRREARHRAAWPSSATHRTTRWIPGPPWWTPKPSRRAPTHPP